MSSLSVVKTCIEDVFLCLSDCAVNKLATILISKFMIHR